MATLPPPAIDQHRQARAVEFRIAAAALVGLIVAAMWPVLSCQFTSWDDFQNIARNPWFTLPAPRAIQHFWLHPHMHLYVPVTYTLWTAVAELARRPEMVNGSFLDPFWFHLLNLLLHCAATVLIFALLKRITRHSLSAWLGAAVFALHPVQVETVAWVSGTKDLLAALLMWAAVAEFLRSVQQPPLRKHPGRKHYVLATLFFLLAMLSKPTALVTPLLAVVVVAAAGTSHWRRVAALLCPWAILAASDFLLAKSAQPTSLHGLQIAFPQRILVSCDALVFYAAKILWPAHLCVDYGQTPQRILAQHAAYSCFALLIAVASAMVLLRRRYPLVLAGAAAAIVTLSPVLGIVPFDFQYYSAVADHYLYPAMGGIALMVAALFSNLRRPTLRTAAISSLGLLLLLCILKCNAQSATWRDTRSLFTQVLQVNPNSWAAYNSLAFERADAGDNRSAFQLAQAAVNANENDAMAHVGLGAMYARAGDRAAAIAQFRRAVEVQPGEAAAHASLAGALGAQGLTQQAIDEAQTAIDLDPTLPDAHLNLAVALASLNRLNEATQEMRLAVALAPDNQHARQNLAALEKMASPQTTPPSGRP
jgi:Flp pilus assembly protein TadD